jgi:hypothetical protein
VHDRDAAAADLLLHEFIRPRQRLTSQKRFSICSAVGSSGGVGQQVRCRSHDFGNRLQRFDFPGWEIAIDAKTRICAKGERVIDNISLEFLNLGWYGADEHYGEEHRQQEED